MKESRIRPYIDKYVAELEELGVIKANAVRAAFAKVPRHQLVDSYYDFSSGKAVRVEVDEETDEFLERVYSNQAIITEVDEETPTSSTSQPSIVAWMLKLLELEQGMKVLEIGAGTGYNAALMAEIVGNQQFVVSLDIQEDVVKRTKRLLARSGYGDIRLMTKDGAEGVSGEAPFDRIIATVGCPDLSPQWEEQLASDGYMLIPLMLGGWFPLVRVWKEGSGLLGRFVGDSGFMLIQGALNGRFWPHAHGAVMASENTERYPAVDNFNADKLPDFHKFMALSDRRTFCNYQPTGYGLYGSENDFAILVFEDGEIIAKGDKQHLEDLLSYYARWQELGQPSRADWIFEFIPLSNEVSKSDSVSVVTRKMYQQVARLI